MKVCKFEGCDRRVHATGLCVSHYSQMWRGNELSPLAVYKKYPAPAPGKKICTSCDRVLDAEKDFYKRTDDTRHTWCKPCYIEKQKVARNKRLRKRANHEDV